MADANSDPNEVSCTIMLCDGAQAVGGKLYIIGGGWSLLHYDPNATPEPRFNIALAIKLEVPYTMANQQIELTVSLLDSEGQSVPDDSGNPVRIEGGFETGRAPGIPAGTPSDIPLAATVGNLALAEGTYVWVVEAGGQQVARASFRVLAIQPQPPLGFMPPG